MKNFRKIGNSLLMAVLIMLSTAACVWDEIVYPEIEVPDTISFSADIVPIFESNCVAQTCHGAGAIDPDLSAANAYSSLISGNYIDTSDPQASFIYSKISPGGSMEQYISAQERALILAWIEDGAQDN